MLTGTRPRTQISLCGRLGLVIDGESLAGGLRGGQARSLLVYLITNRERSVTRTELVEMLWPERAPKDPHAHLRPILSGIRRALGEQVLEGREQLRLLLPPPVWVDSEAARTSIEAARAAAGAEDWRQVHDRAREAASLLEPGFLPGFEGDWIDALRREHEELELEALEWVARSALSFDVGEVSAAQEAGRELVERSPYRESGYRYLMEAFAAAGNVAEALRVYETLRCLLRDELGIFPAPEVQALHAGLLKGDMSSRRTGEGHQLPLPAPLARHAARGRFIGRGDALDALVAAWTSAVDGRASPVVMEGEPGAGKTRLAGEFARRVHTTGAIVLYGRCSEEPLGGYEPFVEALEGWAQACSLDELRACAGGRGGELAVLLPSLGRRLNNLTAPARADAELERYRLLDAVGELVSRLAAVSPVLLVLDDLHWADKSTLLLYRYLSRVPVPAPMLMLTTYRRSELSSAHPFDALLDDLRREGGYQHVSIAGLSEAETAALVAVHVGGESPAELSRAIFEQTEGNPFYVESLVHHLAEQGRLSREAGQWQAAGAIAEVGIPEGIKDVIRRRLARLGGQGARALLIAAVCGRRFHLDVLAPVAGVEADGLAEVLEEAVDARLIEESPAAPGEFRFTHALIREALYEQITAARKVRLHCRIGEELERLHAAEDESQLPILAYHFSQAAPTVAAAAKAVHYARRAAERAATQLAFEEAAEYYERALSVLTGAGGHADGVRLELLLGLGNAYASAGAAQDGRRTFKAAAELARKLDAPLGLARAALGFGLNRFLHLLQSAVDEELIGLLGDALARLPAEQDLLRARLLARLSMELHYTYDVERMAALLQEAVETARRSGDKGTLARAMSMSPSLMSFEGYGLDRPEERLMVASEALELSKQHGDSEDELYSRCGRVMALIQLGDFAGVDDEIAAVERLAAHTRVRQYLWFARTWGAMRALMQGRFADAQRLAQEAFAVGAETIGEGAALHFGYQLSAARTLTGEFEGIEQSWRAAEERQPQLLAIQASLAWLYAQFDRIDEARACLERVGAGADIPHDGTWLLIGFFLASVCSRLEDAEFAERLYPQLLPYAGTCVSEGGPGSLCYGSMALPLGQLAAAMSRWEDAQRHFEAALRENTRIGARPWVAWTAVDYASLLMRHATADDRDRAIELLDQAVKTSHELGMKPLASRGLALRRALVLS